jgi:hypothetical protein
VLVIAQPRSPRTSLRCIMQRLRGKRQFMLRHPMIHGPHATLSAELETLSRSASPVATDRAGVRAASKWETGPRRVATLACRRASWFQENALCPVSRTNHAVCTDPGIPGTNHFHGKAAVCKQGSVSGRQDSGTENAPPSRIRGTRSRGLNRSERSRIGKARLPASVAGAIWSRYVGGPGSGTRTGSGSRPVELLGERWVEGAELAIAAVREARVCELVRGANRQFDLLNLKSHGKAAGGGMGSWLGQWKRQEMK